VAVDSSGQYSLLLGATRPDGVPLELFSSGDARWLAIRFSRQGEGGDQPRTRLTSVRVGTAGANGCVRNFAGTAENDEMRVRLAALERRVQELSTQNPRR